MSNTKKNSKRRFTKGGRTPKEVESGSRCFTQSKEDSPHVITDAKTNNDPRWYTNIGPIASDYASLPYSYPLGVGLPVGNPNISTTTAIDPSAKNSAGIITLDVAPGIGICRNSTDPANIAAQQLYTMDRKANSGATNYDKTDLMMVIVAMDSAYMLYEELLRAYRCLGVYNTMNRYLPDVLLQSLGFEPSIGDSMADFRGVLDLFAYKLASVNVPDQFDIIHRHSWLFTNVYADSENQKAQLYAMKPDGFFVWTEGKSSEPTFLDYTKRYALYGLSNAGDRVSSIAQIRHAIDTIMTPILGSQDVGVISGDLAKAFGDGGMIKIQPVQSHEALQITFNNEVCHQIMNAEILPYGALIDADISVDMSNLSAGPQLKYTPRVQLIAVGDQYIAPTRERNHLINLKGMTPSPETNLVATRYNLILGPSGGPNICDIMSCGTEIVTSATMYQFNINNSGIITEVLTQSIRSDVVLRSADKISTLQTILGIMCQRSHFNFSPSMHVWMTTDGSVSGKAFRYIGVQQDLNEFTWIDDDTMTALNTVCVMSEFSAKDFSISVK